MLNSVLKICKSYGFHWSPQQCLVLLKEVSVHGVNLERARLNVIGQWVESVLSYVEQSM
jgi:uncharacterized protein (DUF697 family)